ncbi:hypothetical protein [Nocardia beijingensis]
MNDPTALVTAALGSLSTAGIGGLLLYRHGPMQFAEALVRLLAATAAILMALTAKGEDRSARAIEILRMTDPRQRDTPPEPPPTEAADPVTDHDESHYDVNGTDGSLRSPAAGSDTP